MVHALRITKKGADVVLDSPKGGVFSNLDLLQFSGWANPSVCQIRIYLLSHELTVFKTISRPDVTSHLNRIGLDTQNDFHGFSVRTEAVPFQIYAVFEDGSSEIQIEGELHRPTNVEMGAGNWLFLSSSNGLLEQANGKMNPMPAINLWNGYLSKVDSLAQEMNIPWCFSIAPSKELVVPELAPFEVAPNNFLKSFLDKSAFNKLLSCPMPEFKRYGTISFWPCDTHWSDVGAAIAAKDVLQKFSIKNDITPNRGIEFSIGIGDLSDKLLGQHVAAFPGIPYPKEVRLTFDNYSEKGGNTGRVMIWESDEEHASGTLFVSGGSSFRWMSKFLTPWFKRTVFQHGTGRIDPKLLREVAPTHLLLQNNSRFLIEHLDEGQFASLASLLNPAQLSTMQSSGYKYYDEVERQVRG